MFKQYKKQLIFTSIVIILPIIIGLLIWNKLPDRVPTHFGIDGTPNGWSSKPFTVFGIPLIILTIHWVAVLATMADPKRKGINPKVFRIVLWIIPAVCLYAMTSIYGPYLGLHMDITLVSMILSGLLFIIIGNYLPKSRQNYTVGIKLPWTLNDEDNWNKTHRLGGKLYMICGLLMILSGLFLKNQSAYILIGIVIISNLILVLYSYILYKNDH